MNFIKLNPMQLLWIKIYQIDAWHSSYPFVLEFKLFSLKFLNNPNSLCSILQIIHRLTFSHSLVKKEIYQVKSDATFYG